jgi:hypothetical protein
VLLKRGFGRQTSSRWRFSQKNDWIVQVIPQQAIKAIPVLSTRKIVIRWQKLGWHFLLRRQAFTAVCCELWSGELQGCTVHEIMKQCLMPSAIRSQKPEEVEEAAALVALLAAPSHHGARRTAHWRTHGAWRIQHTARQRPALRAGSVLCRSVAVAVALRAAACGWRLRLRLRLRRTANGELRANCELAYFLFTENPHLRLQLQCRIAPIHRQDAKLRPHELAGRSRVSVWQGQGRPMPRAQRVAIAPCAMRLQCIPWSARGWR